MGLVPRPRRADQDWGGAQGRTAHRVEGVAGARLPAGVRKKELMRTVRIPSCN